MILFPQKYYAVSIKKTRPPSIFFSHKTTSASGLDPFSKSTSVTTFFKKKYNLPEIGSVKQIYHWKTASCCNLCTIHRSHDLFSTRSLVNVVQSFFQDQQTNLQGLTAVPSLTGFEPKIWQTLELPLWPRLWRIPRTEVGPQASQLLPPPKMFFFFRKLL